MAERAEGEITRILRILADSRRDSIQAGGRGGSDSHGDGSQADTADATARLFAAAYHELHRIATAMMRNERPSHTLQATALVNETYLRLIGEAPIAWESRAHFFGVVASAMRRVLVKYARDRSAEKRGGCWKKIAFDANLQLAGRSEIEILELDRILSKFASIDPRAARVVEMRAFGGLRESEIGEVLGISERTVRHDWRFAAAWLGRELQGCSGP